MQGLIPHAKIEEIMNAANIESVIGDYVRLKKRGVNLLGNCPFHGEKTPSFTVSPVKGIYKCFGCGKAGNVVNFIMEHDSLGYVQALKFLADKFNIEWPKQEQVNIDEEKKQQNERDSLQILNNWSAEYFENILWNDSDGQTIGLGYFEERGFRHDIIKKFHLGYSKDSRNAYLDEAIKNQYNTEVLVSSGLVKQSEDGKKYDAYRGRVIFPIHGNTGKVIAFAGRFLKKDPKSPKYVNSPETILYHKSNELYGLYFAKNIIKQKDSVYLVEGYTDVISMHQAGVENVVASSGTSLTENQTKLIKRFTDNVIVLYDGDAAGIKASLRGIDMLLEQGLNVKVVLFPDGEDPDSYSIKVGSEVFSTYLKESSKDFILFKLHLLLGDTKGDPVKKAAVVRDIVESIVKIPDVFKRAAFIKECSQLLEMDEQLLISEANKSRRNFVKQQEKDWIEKEPQTQTEETLTYEQAINETLKEIDGYHQEKDIVRLLLKYGNNKIENYINAAHFILHELHQDEIEIEHSNIHLFIDEYKRQLEVQGDVNDTFFIQHSNADISTLTADVLGSQLTTSPHWGRKFDYVVEAPEVNYANDIASSLRRIKQKYLDKKLQQTLKNIHEASDEETNDLYQHVYQILLEQKTKLALETGTVVQRWFGT